MKKIVAIILLAAITMICAGQKSARAGWVDDWLQEKTVSSPDYLAGQKRGYFTGGSFDARWYQGQNDYLFSVEPPKFKAGCGGIDAFMGGFSFMNFNYLVKKLQSILTAAPAMAFDLTLSTYCPQCSTILGKFENISDKLNGLQFNDCTASKAVVAQLMGPYTRNSGQYEHALSDYAASQGWTSLWQDIKQATSSAGDIAAAPNTSGTPNLSGMYSGCPQDVKNLFLTQGSLLDHLRAQFGGGSADYIALLRGFIGDVDFSADKTGIIYPSPIGPCDTNLRKSVDNFIAGNTEAKSDSGTCAPLPDVNANLETWAANTMTGIIGQMEAQGRLTSDQVDFLRQIPLPMELILKYAVSTSQEAAMASEFSTIAAKAYAYAMMADLDHNAQVLIDKGLIVARDEPSSVANTSANRCDVHLLATSPVLLDYKKRLDVMQTALAQDYTKWASSLYALQSLGRRLEEFNAQAYRNLSEKFNPSLAERAVGE